jgi:hypothetical protein
MTRNEPANNNTVRTPKGTRKPSGRKNKTQTGKKSTKVVSRRVKKDPLEGIPHFLRLSERTD